MKKSLIAVAAALLFGITISAQAQDAAEDTLEALGTAFAPYIAAFEQLVEVFKPLPVCADLEADNLLVSNLDAAVTLGAVYCREITHDSAYQMNPGAIGDQRVIERNVQQAYDVFGMTVEGAAVEQFNDPITVCLRGRGDLLFLPAFASPRPIQTPQSYSSDGFTCARLGSSGIVALVGE